MAYVHIAHDCQIASHTIFANNAQLAGHVHIGDYAILGGFTAVHQFCRIGAHSITGLATVVLQDIPPYVKASGNPVHPYGINSEGLRRRGFSADAVAAIKRAYRTLYRSGPFAGGRSEPRLRRTAGASPEVQPLVDFLAVAGRGIVR
jgi:UDP-N-acetylglucosamine acyltransferase